MYIALIMDIKQFVIQNIFNKTYHKRALIIYTTPPFWGYDDHTNANEVKVMAMELDSLGYTVDVIDYEYSGTHSASTYNIIIGQGQYFESCCISDECANATKVAYLTAKNPDFNNMAELKRLRFFRERNGVTLPIIRYDNSFSNRNVLMHINHAIAIGKDSLTRETWKDFFDQIEYINATGFDNLRLPDLNKAPECFSHFLWLGSTGGIHKGLDLLIEAFTTLPHLHLHIVGAGLDGDLANIYHDRINNSENIHYYGWVNHNDAVFLQLFELCGFIVCPSCSEGQCTSVLTAMFAGMIPVCTVETGIEMELCDGYYIENIEPKNIASLLSDIAQTPKEILIQKSMKAYEYVITNHTLDAYQQDIANSLAKIINSHSNDNDLRSELMKQLNETLWVEDGCLQSSLCDFYKDQLYILCPFGIGDTLYVCSYIKAFKEKKCINNITLIIKDNHKALVECFPDINSFICSTELVKLIHKWTKINNIAQLTNYLFGHFELVPGILENGIASPIYLYRNIVLGLDNDAQMTFPILNSNNVSALNEKYHLSNPTVIVMPYAVSIPCIDMLFWETLVAILVKAGYQVYTNVKDESEKPVALSMPISESIPNTVEISKQSTIVISMRSGMCDMMAMCGTNLVVIDTVKDYFETWNLSSLFNSSSISAYLYESPLDMEPLLKEILCLLNIQI